MPQPGAGWWPQGQPARQPHEYVRGGTAKLLTLLHPATGQVRVQGATSCTNAVLHGWLKQELADVLVGPSSSDRLRRPPRLGRARAEPAGSAGGRG